MSFMPPIQVKICGLTTQAHVATALDGGVDFIGFMIFPKSPRHIEPFAARPLAEMADGRAKTVAILVNPDDELITKVLSDLNPDYIQLHGGETPQFCAALRSRGVGVVKAFGVSDRADLGHVQPYLDAVDMILFDAKPPTQADIPGGLGEPFDWAILKGYEAPVPWFLSGGLTLGNVMEAVNATGAKMVDVSSGVESARGLKDDALMRAFLTAAKQDR
jgi:phosphoribosylanthranilate isomerase